MATPRPKHKKLATPKPNCVRIETLRSFQTEPKSSTPPATQPKEKVKTGVVAGPPSEPIAAQEPKIEESPAQVVQLVRGPHKTMRALFPADSQDRTGSKVLWKDFVSTMQELDFSITSLNDSASLLEPAWKPGSSHEPHPGNEIRIDLLRDYGRRLSTVFGRTADTSVLA